MIIKIKILLFLFVVSLLFTNCNKPITRDKKYGGTLKINASDVPETIFPGQVLKLSEQLIINHVYVGLLKYNPRNIEITSSLAKKWRVEKDETLYTFYLHGDAVFQKDKCFKNSQKTRKITAADVKYSIEQIAHFHVNLKHEISSQLKNIQGADSLLNSSFQNKTVHINGINVINDTTIIFKLKKPDPLFVHFLASTNTLVFPKEAFEAYGFKSTVGSGAYCFKNPDVFGHAITLTANPGFFMKNNQGLKLPFIDTIIISFITSPPKELMMFENGDLDMVVGVNNNYVSDFLDKHIDEFQSNPPYYVMKEFTAPDNMNKYNFLRSNIKNIYINSIGYFDFTETYFEEPQPQMITMN